MGSRDTPFDAAGFSELVDEHHPALYAFARRRLTDAASIEDVLAETFVTAWRRRADIPEPPLPWLYGVCLRVISTQRRSARRRLRLWGRLASERPAAGRDPAELVARRSEISEAFATLSAGDREVLRLIAWDGLSTAEAAAVLGCTPGAFRVRYHRARRQLEKHLAAGGHEQVMTKSTDEATSGSAG